jgi:hypothetical protein
MLDPGAHERVIWVRSARSSIARSCRRKGVACTYVYEPASIFTDGSLDVIDDHRLFPLFR